MSLLSDTALSQKVQRNAPGIVYHLADIYIPELSSVLNKEKTASNSEGEGEGEQKIEDGEESLDEIESDSSVTEGEEGTEEEGDGDGDNQKEEEKEEEETEEIVEGDDSTDLEFHESPLLSIEPTLLCSLLSPFSSLLATSNDSTIVKRVRKSVFDPLCRELQEADAIGGLLSLSRSVLSYLFSFSDYRRQGQGAVEGNFQ